MLAESIDNPSETDNRSNRRLPRRDWIALPLLSLATVLVMLAGAELLARHFWPAQEEDSCFDNGRFRANCTSVVKVPEGQWATDRYNDCGYRSASPCASKIPGTFRIVLFGSSAAHGLYLPFDDIFPVRAGRKLQKTTRRAIDVQNLGIPNTNPLEWSARIGEALKLKPDAVVFTITPFDVEQIGARRTGTQPEQLSLYKRLQHSVTESRAALVAQHYVFSDRERFLRFYLLYGDRADFLREPLSAAWRDRYQKLDTVVADASERLHAAHVPFYLLVLPSRAEAALLSGASRPANLNPFSFRDRVSETASRRGAVLMDGVAAFAKQPNPETLFYVVDGHIKPAGQALIAATVAEAIHVP
jgi:hypothetical protein